MADPVKLREVGGLARAFFVWSVEPVPRTETRHTGLLLQSGPPVPHTPGEKAEPVLAVWAECQKKEYKVKSLRSRRPRANTELAGPEL